MQDFNGKHLNLGDTVIFIAPGYRSLVKGTVIAFTNKFVRVSYTNFWNYGHPGLTKNFLQSPDQLVKFDKLSEN